jgi:serine/threonine protein kinase
LDPPHHPGYNHWRLYQPLYDYGDLQKLITAHYYNQKVIPEPFIWHTFMCLMRAAVQLEEQAQLRPGEKTPSGVIVVFDMKPANIFLAQPDRTSTFHIYPRPHIADLGGGSLTSDTDYPNESSQMEYAYSPGFLAPEMSIAIREDYLRGTCTNVWQIGRVLEYMMKLELEDGRFEDIEYRPYPELKAAQMEPQIVDYHYRFPAQNNYSAILKEMVYDCLRFDPRKRPKPQDVLARIEKLKPLFRGMDTFGNDEWFSAKQENRTKLPKPHLSPASEADKQRRIVEARPYLRAWGPTRAAEYADLGVFPPE